MLQQTMCFICGNCRRQCMTISPTRAFPERSLTMKPGNHSSFSPINMDKYRNIWMKRFSNEIGHLTQGICDVPGTNNIDLILHSNVSFGNTVTYGRIFCMYRPQKTEKNHTRLTVGGNMFTCLYGVSAPTSDMTTAKLLFNSVISTPGA